MWMHTRSAINHAANHRIRVQLGQKLSCHGIVTDLRELECHAASSVPSADLLNRVLDGVVCRSLFFTGGLAIGDGNDEGWLGVASASQFGDDDSINDFLSQGRAHGRESFEADRPHQLVDLLLGSDIVQHVDVVVAVHEA